jgi:hypothetical protein
MKPNEIIAALLKLDPTVARQTLKEAYAALERKARNSIDEGQTVTFVAKGGARITGVVKAVNRKNVIVEASLDRYGLKTPRPVRWTVSPSLLSVVENDGSKA